MVPQTLTKMNLFVDGKSYAGRHTEVTPAPLKRITETIHAGGTGGEVEISLGIGLIEAGFKMIGVDPDIMAYFGIADDSAFNGVFRGAFKDQKGKTTPVIITMRGMLKELNPGAWGAGQKSECSYSVSCSYYKVEVDGKVLHEIDQLNMICIVNGVDELAAERAAIGL